jgi:Flp pilus assembly protein TadD
MPWGVGWVLGGGNKKKALAVMQEAIDAHDDFYANAEALFGLWDMQVREKNFEAALVPARRLAELFPDNLDVAKFLATRNQAAAR